MKKYINLGVVFLISVMVVLGIVLLSFSALALSALIAIACVSVLIVPITWIFGIVTGQSYDRVCDNSEIIYNLNKIGKWTLVIGIGIGILVFFLHFA